METEKAELCDAETQTEVTELSVIQRKELLELKKENSCLKEKLEKKASMEIFSEEFLMNEKNQHILKFYTGTYAAYLFSYINVCCCRISRIGHLQCFLHFWLHIYQITLNFQNCPWC